MVPLYWVIKAPAIVYNRYKDEQNPVERNLGKELAIGLVVTFIILALVIGLPLLGLALIIMLLG